MHDVQLLAGGSAYGGWKSVQVQLGMEQMAGQFTVGLSERWAGQEVDRQVPAGARCEVQIDGETVITGWVDGLRQALDSGRRAVEISGRDATADLVDCSAVAGAGQWRGRRIEQIAAELCAPFGVQVVAEVDTGKPLPSYALQEGETVFEALERAARLRALLLTSDGTGRLVITRAGQRRAPTALVMGENIVGIEVRTDMRDRYSAYTAKGQMPGTDTTNGAAAAQLRALATDEGVRRHRPLVLTADAPDAGATLQQRAAWEANVRAARSVEVAVVVQGWRHAAGLWRPNTLVRVEAPAVRLEQDMLLSAVQYALDERGTLCELRLTRPEAYTLLPVREPAEAVQSRTGTSWWDR